MVREKREVTIVMERPGYLTIVSSEFKPSASRVYAGVRMAVRERYNF